jgi:MFS family permease
LFVLILTLLPVFTAVFFLIVGNGLLTTLVPLRAAIEHFSASQIGFIGASYFAGMIAGTFLAPLIVRRIGQVRAFSAYAALVASAALGFALTDQLWIWMALRAANGFALGGLYGIVESWIIARAGPTQRGRALGLYNITHFSGSALGQQFLRLYDPRGFQLFSLAAISLLAALLPLAVTRSDPPPLPARGRLIFAQIQRMAPIGLTCIGLVGIVNGSFWSLAPAYIEHLGMGTQTVATFMTIFIIGCACGPYPLGRMSDLIDRRGVIAAVSLISILIEIGLASLGTQHVELLYILGYLMGILLPSLYPLTVAHVMDQFTGEDAVLVSSTLLFCYCIGAVIGPVIASYLMQTFGDWALFLHNGLAHFVLGLFVIAQILRNRNETIRS